MRCAIYTRVSTDEQAASDYSSLKRQEEICRKYVDIHAGSGEVAEGHSDVRGALLRLKLRDHRMRQLDAVDGYPSLA